VAFRHFGGDLRRFAWRDMVCAAEFTPTDVPRLRAREEKLASGTTPFAARMRALLALRGSEQVRKSAYDLHRWLEVLSEDDQEPGACDCWFLVSRGYEVLPRGTAHPTQVTPNYQSALDNADHVDAEIARLLTAGHILRYRDAAAAAGYPGVKPVCILACGMVLKLSKAGLKLRLVCDGSAPHNGRSLNDTMEIPKCRLTSVDQAASTCGKHSYVSSIDEADAYMQTPCSAWSVRYLSIQWRGVVYAFVCMNFGLSSACHAQQSLAVALHRALRRRLVRGGLHCNPTSTYDQRQVALPPINEQRQRSARTATKIYTNKHRHLLRGHSALAHFEAAQLRDGFKAKPPLPSAEARAAHRALDVLIAREKRAGRRIDSCSGLQQYLDDFFQSSTSRRSAFWIFLQALSLFQLLHVRVNMKPGKTAAPAQVYEFLGICGDLRDRFELYLSADRVSSMLDAIQTAITAGGATVASLASLIGLLVFCSSVVEARPYYRALLSILTKNCYDDRGRWSRARKSFFIVFSAAELRDLKAWHIVLRVHNGSDISRGIRRNVAPFELYSDASGTGLGFCYAGFYVAQDIPTSWAPFVFAKKDSHVRILQARLEAWASLLGMRYAIPRCGGVGATLRVRSDSMVFIGQARKMSSSDQAVQPILREVLWLAAVYGVRLEFIHLPAASIEIGFVDSLSRRTEADPGGKRAAIMAAGKIAAKTQFAQASAMGVHALGTMERPDLAPFLDAERCQALQFDVTWSAQRRDQLDALVEDGRLESLSHPTSH